MIITVLLITIVNSSKLFFYLSDIMSKEIKLSVAQIGSNMNSMKVYELYESDYFY